MNWTVIFFLLKLSLKNLSPVLQVNDNITVIVRDDEWGDGSHGTFGRDAVTSHCFLLCYGSLLITIRPVCIIEFCASVTLMDSKFTDLLNVWIRGAFNYDRPLTLSPYYMHLVCQKWMHSLWLLICEINQIQILQPIFKTRSEWHESFYPIISPSIHFWCYSTVQYTRVGIYTQHIYFCKFPVLIMN